MKIIGVQKTTLLDFPGHIACTVFLGGCNFKCPFCYNSSLIDGDSSSFIAEKDFFSFLNKRKGILDGVAITGGEPLLNPEIKDFIKKIKELGFKVKLDTNGSFPDSLQSLIEDNLLDYVAMDIKNTFEKYRMTTNCCVNIDNIKRSIQILLEGKIDYEFRTTVVKEFHSIEDFEIISKNIKGAKNYFLQSYQEKDSVLNKTLHPLTKDDLQACAEVARKNVLNVKLRGID